MKKNIIITGNSRRIVFKMDKKLTENAQQVLTLTKNEKPVQELKLKNLESFSFDNRKPEDIQKVKDYVKEKWQKVDVLIHNAGQFLKGDFENISLEKVRAVYETNVFGVYGLTQSLLSFMKKESHIIAISSMGGIQGSVKFPGLTA